MLQGMISGLDAGALYSAVAELRSANAAELATGDKRKTQASALLDWTRAACMPGQ